MKNWRAPGYKNYGMIPANEYTTTSTDKNKNLDAVSEQAPQAEDRVRERHVPKWRTRYGKIRGGSRGWLHSRSTNGWRAEAASQQDEAAEKDMELMKPK